MISLPEDSAISVSDFYKAASNGILLGLRCESNHFTVPPKRTCQVCGSERLESIPLSGRGEVLCFSEVWTKSKEFPVETPYTLVLVALDEGGKLLGILEGGGEEVPRGTKVSVKFRKTSDRDREWPRIFFSLEKEGP